MRKGKHVFNKTPGQLGCDSIETDTHGQGNLRRNEYQSFSQDQIPNFEDQYPRQSDSLLADNIKLPRQSVFGLFDGVKW